MNKYYEIRLKNGNCYEISGAQFANISKCLSLPRSERPDFLSLNRETVVIRVDFIAEIYPEGRGKIEPYEMVAK